MTFDILITTINYYLITCGYRLQIFIMQYRSVVGLLTKCNFFFFPPPRSRWYSIFKFIISINVVIDIAHLLICLIFICCLPPAPNIPNILRINIVIKLLPNLRNNVIKETLAGSLLFQPLFEEIFIVLITPIITHTSKSRRFWLWRTFRCRCLGFRSGSRQATGCGFTVTDKFRFSLRFLHT